MPKLIVLSSGTKSGGGSGFRNLAEQAKTGILQAEIVAVVSNHAQGGVYEHAKAMNIPFEHFTGPWEPEEYQKVVAKYGAEWTALSGWLKLVCGLDPQKTFNIHPGPLPQFGGDGMYGKHVHEAVLESFQKGEATSSAVTMHFVTEKYDEGPVFFQLPVPIYKDDTIDTLSARVNAFEHAWQPTITNLAVHKQIHWDGKDQKTLVVPDWLPH